MKPLILWFTVMLVLLPACTVAADAIPVAECDIDGDGALNRDELVKCFLKLDVPTQKAKAAKSPEEVAEVAVDDLLDFRKEPVSFEVADARLQRRAIEAADADPPVLISKRLSVGRKLTDAVDPRKTETTVPFVVSFTKDKVAKTHTWIASGSLTYTLAEGDASEHVVWALLPGVDADVSTKTAPDESKLDFGVPLRFGWTNTSPGSTRLLDDAQFGLELHYQTDRKFRADVYQISLPFLFSSRRLARAGLNSYFGGNPLDRQSRFVFYWQPSMQVELARITDAGSSEKLAAIKESGDSVRLAPAIAMKLTLPMAQQKVSIGAGYTHRFDLAQNSDHGYATASLQYNLTSALALTFAWKRGRKPPDFAEANELLFGIGLQQGN